MHRQDVFSMLSNLEDKIRIDGLQEEGAPDKGPPLREVVDSLNWESIFGKQAGVLPRVPAAHQVSGRTA